MKSMPDSWRRETKPHKFCPGCGHGLVLKALGMAMDRLKIADRTVFGVDIGCSLLAWDFFNADTIQTHHGRTVPVIIGAKRARPNLVGIAYMGDGGGYAIGSQHLINATMRNDRILIIIVNNTIYAMTGGQMAPTTLKGQKTETSSRGRDPKYEGFPLRGPEMVASFAPEGAYVARGSVSHVQRLARYLERGLENQLQDRGISVVEALSTCPTNWRTNAEDTWKFLEKEMTDYYPVGELVSPFKRDTQKEAADLETCH
ncbi:MAG: thiamine pyrophosphate-dependent enzyme [Bacillota bacterium]|nr:thiamine pyrophosphate-dependent enzyme [Bacillota bacterium]